LRLIAGISIREKVNLCGIKNAAIKNLKALFQPYGKSSVMLPKKGSPKHLK
jgi:hypothetical protein